MTARRVVRAAGCVVWRRSGEDAVEVLVIHRPAPHDDWSLPKGKLERGERHRDAAVREVFEETAVSGRIGPKLLEVRYDTPAGEDKRVRWWSMRAQHDAGFQPGSEVDEVRWYPLAEVPAVLSWDSDRKVVTEFTSTTPWALPEAP